MSAKTTGGRYEGAAELLRRAVDTLASGTSHVHDRLEDAALFLTQLREDELPPQFVARFRPLVKRLTNEGTIAATVRAMSDGDASRLAEEIVAIAWDVACWEVAALNG
jgi:hypothetical protein